MKSHSATACGPCCTGTGQAPPGNVLTADLPFRQGIHSLEAARIQLDVDGSLTTQGPHDDGHNEYVVLGLT